MLGEDFRLFSRFATAMVACSALCWKPALWGAATVLLMLAAPSAAGAHVICGNRVFPATLTMDDPGVGDELSLPTIQLVPTSSGQSIAYGYEWDKSITRDLGIALNGDYASERSASQGSNGWDNLTLTLKDELPCKEKHELAWSIGVVRELPGTGASQLRNSGAIDSVGSTAPTFYIGKGLGDLPIDALRPFAVTGELSRQFSDSPGQSPSTWNYAASLQYSMPYQQQHVKALNVPRFVTRLTPLVEVSMSSPSVGPTTGTIAPGVLYSGKTWQLGAEALLPANKSTSRSQSIGVLVQFHLFLDDAAWKTFLGKPLINKDLWK
jgi:hypothetical protein